MITHDSQRIPAFAETWDPSDKEYIWISWADVLNGATISVSAWTLPTGWTSHATLTNQTAVDEDGANHANSNGVQTSTTHTKGLHLIANKVTLSDGRILERSVRVRVAQA